MGPSWVKQRREMRRGLKTRCYAVRRKGFEYIGEAAMEPSTDGVFLPTEVVFQPDEEILLSIKLPRGSSWVDAHARVARVVHGRRSGDVRGVGIEFVKMDAVDRALWRSSLRGHPPSPSRRGRTRDYAARIRRIASEKRAPRRIGDWHDVADASIGGWFSAPRPRS